MCPYYLYVAYVEGLGRAHSGSYRHTMGCTTECQRHGVGYLRNELRDQVCDQLNDHVDLRPRLFLRWLSQDLP